MPASMTKEDAQAWIARWKLVEDFQREELRKETYEEKFRSLAVLFSSAGMFDMPALHEEDEIARERWARLQSLILRK